MEHDPEGNGLTASERQTVIELLVDSGNLPEKRRCINSVAKAAFPALPDGVFHEKDGGDPATLDEKAVRACLSFASEETTAILKLAFSLFVVSSICICIEYFPALAGPEG